MLIVATTFLLIAQDFVGFRGFFELMDRVGVTLIRVRMILERKLAIGFRDFILRGGLLYAEDLVVTSFCGHVQARDSRRSNACFGIGFG